MNGTGKRQQIEHLQSDRGTLINKAIPEMTMKMATSLSAKTGRRRTLLKCLKAHPTKRKININAFPWTVHDEINPPKLHPMLAKTRELLSNYMLNVKFAKTHLLNSAHCPQFPDSEWTNILSGHAVDLDQVLSSSYTISHNTHQTKSFGSVELIIGTAKPTKTVNTHGKWVIAWNQTIDALLFAFPHRVSELCEYT
ncbi:hypothetical protein BDQ12DRAFT_666497 [Crucibulum laeve]|uniref:Uncharacterized protein n=1 Tax=Crucibulum laeve TaxID=68775 RepID=A0A5C3MAX2_9AGAR|nr:hypothetical protein BDQ12DRAFT_666497 [Crucibulum laeve]